MRISGEDIKRLIPQRYPFLMVDEFEQRDDNTAVTTLEIRQNNYFITYDGTMAETGLIEHMAQSCSALAGAKNSSDIAPIGMIVEIKNFLCQRRPNIGERLDSTVSFDFSFGQMTLAHGVTNIGEEKIAEVDFKIYVQ